MWEYHPSAWDSGRDEIVSQDLGTAVEKFLLVCRKCGTPSSRNDWKIVLARLITASDESLREVARQGRMLGVSWIVPVAEAILEELASGRAYRAADGAVTLRDKPKAKGLEVLL